MYSPPGADFPAVTQTVISSTKYNNVINDIATGLSLCLTKDGQQVATANIPFGGFRATNVGITAVAGSVGTPAINVSDAATGLYRSAVSELAVTVAGVQRGRFDATGLIITGTLTASNIVLPATGAISWGTGKLTGILSGTAIQLNGELVASDSGVPGALSLFGGSHVDNTRWLASDSPGDGFNRFVVTINGDLQWGPGNTALDTKLLRGGLGNMLLTGSGIGVLGTQVLAGGAGSQVSALNAGQTDYEQYNIIANGIILTSRTGVGTAAQVARFDAVAGSNRGFTFVSSNGGSPTLSTTAGSLAITPAVVMASTLAVTGGITPNFTSAETAIPAAGTITNIAHGLTTVPTLFYVIMRNKTAELGFSIGDEVVIPGPAGAAIVADTTNISVNLAANTMIRKDTTVLTAFTAASWKFVARAYK